MFARACFQFQTHPFGRMRHGAGEDLLGEARASLCQGHGDGIDQPVLQHPNAPHTAFGKPPPAFEQRLHVTRQGNPFEQILDSSRKFLAFFG